MKRIRELVNEPLNSVSTGSMAFDIKKGLRLVLHALKLSQMYTCEYYSLPVGHYYQEKGYYSHHPHNPRYPVKYVSRDE